jgi:phosphoribosylglycinamide formyltransferase-1
MRTAVLASGGGTNLQALIDAARAPDYPAEIALVLTNVPGAYCLERAEKAGIQTALVNHLDYPDRSAFEGALNRILQDHGIELICLAGFLRILTGAFVNAWHDRMLNIHPSLLPKYKGLHTHQRALAAQDIQAGCTVHLVRPSLDDGPMLIQAEVPILPGDSAESLASRVLEREHMIFPQGLALVASGRVDVKEDQAFIDGKPGPLQLLWQQSLLDA